MALGHSRGRGSADLGEPLRILQRAQEGSGAGLEGLTARDTRLQQLLEAGLHLPGLKHLDGHQLPLLQGVWPHALEEGSMVRPARLQAPPGPLPPPVTLSWALSPMM